MLTKEYARAIGDDYRIGNGTINDAQILEIYLERSNDFKCNNALKCATDYIAVPVKIVPNC